jgi:biotin carboxylase
LSNEVPHLLLVGGKDSSFGPISELGIDITLIQVSGHLTPLQISRAKRLLLVDSLDLELFRTLARAVHQTHPFDGALSFTEHCLLPASIIGEELGVRCNPLSAVRLTRDKLMMRKLLADCEVKPVRYGRCDTLGDLKYFASKIELPLIVKPSNGVGSRGVALIERIDDIEKAWECCLDYGELPAIVEEYIEGPELSVETLTRNGVHEVLAMTEKVTTGPPRFIETGHQLPGRIPSEVFLSIERQVSDFLNAIGHRFGPAHTEFRVTRRMRPTIIESHTRFGGDQIWEMVQLVRGIPMAAATAASMFDLPDVRADSRCGGAAVRYFAYERGTIEAIEGICEARLAPGVLRVDVWAQKGEELGALSGSDSRQGYVLAGGYTTEEAVANAEAAQALVRFFVT